MARAWRHSNAIVHGADCETTPATERCDVGQGIAKYAPSGSGGSGDPDVSHRHTAAGGKFK